MRRLLPAVAFASLALGALPVSAQVAPEPVSGARQHDGLFLRFQGGPAYLDLTQDDGDAISGLGLGLHLAIGGSPSENVVIFGEWIAQEAPGPTMESEGIERELDMENAVGLSYAGPGIAYYFGTSNVFLSGGLGFATATLSSGPSSLALEGYGARLGLGKEWWVDDQWGLGVAADVLFARVALEDEDLADDALTAASVGVSFCATYQ